PVNTAQDNNVFHLIPAFDNLNNISGDTFDVSQLTYVFDDQIGQDCAASTGGCGAADLVSMRHWVCAHEVGHQFRVNECSAAHHATRSAWCADQGGTCIAAGAMDQDCLMVPSGPPTVPELDMRADGIDHFCKEDLVLGDPNCPAGPPRQGAIRTWEDPQ